MIIEIYIYIYDKNKNEHRPKLGNALSERMSERAVASQKSRRIANGFFPTHKFLIEKPRIDAAAHVSRECSDVLPLFSPAFREN